MKYLVGAVGLSLVISILFLTGCRDPSYHQADNKVLYDSNGCAYFVNAGVDGYGNLVVQRISDSDKSTCTESKVVLK